MKRSLQDINFWVKEINENKDLNIEIIKLENIRNNKFFLSILNNDTDKDVIYMEYLIRFKSGQIISLFRQVLLKEYSYRLNISENTIIEFFKNIINRATSANVILSSVYLDNNESKYFQLEAGSQILMLNSKIYFGEDIICDVQELTEVNTFKFYEGDDFEGFFI